MKPAYNHVGFSLGYRAGRMLPRGWCRGIGGVLGLAGYLGGGEPRRAARRNLGQVTGGNGTGLDRLCRANFRNFGRMLGDYFYCAGSEPEAIRALVRRWDGLEHLRAGLEQGRGVILVTAHLGNWELGGALLALDQWPINVVTLPEPTGELTRMRDANRQRLGIRTIAVGADPFSFVEVIAALQRNEIVCMLVDRPYGETGVPVEFFGCPTAFSSAPALLWRHTGARVIPAFVIQGQEGGDYLAFTREPISLESGGDRQENLARNTQEIASVFESVIRQHPEQWFNYVPIWKNTGPHL